MRRISKLLVTIGVFFLVIAGAWRFVAPGQLVKYPDDLDKTVYATGTLTLYADPATAAPQPSPTPFPLDIKRRVHVVESSTSKVVVQEDDVEKIGPLPEQNFLQRYVIDRSSLKNLAEERAYAYTAQNKIDRSPNYSINLPFDAGDGPYSIWKNEVGAPYPFRQDGPSVERAGLTLRPMHGRLEKAPVQGYYIDQLRSQGIPRQLTLQQLSPQLKAQGLDPQQFATQVLPQLSAADQAEIVSVISQPISLNYLLDVDTRLLVEPRTGAIVSLDRINQTIYAQPDLAGIGRIQTILAKPEYAGNTTVTGAEATLARLVRTPPTTRIFNIDYSQTSPSVADLASYATDLGDQINLIKKVVPLFLIIFGGGLAAIGVALSVLRRSDGRGRNTTTSEGVGEAGATVPTRTD
ncbi:porin PorA family protein [Frankia sp. Cas4]|uniref:porin PorA family protein n=1 Tax=Frankia sp. Cas4 TaxID=3073927 RepID=UPI002AD273BF|nr:porin PorA family protein [Frankia sp. Cas4]